MSLASDECASLSSSDKAGSGHLDQLNLRNIDILESIKDAFAAFDREWRFTYVNAAAERLLGMPREQLIGKCHWDLFAGTLGTIVEENYRRAASEGVTVEFEFFYEHWKRWFAITCYPAANGGLSNYFGISRKQSVRRMSCASRIKRWNEPIICWKSSPTSPATICRNRYAISSSRRNF